jgi:uncharacterized protein
MDEAVLALLRRAKVIAVVGLSADISKPSFAVARSLQERGYRIVPVNPTLPEILGEKCFPNLCDFPGKVDIVDIFRRREAVPAIVEEAIVAGAGCVWMQEGVSHPEAASRAREAGILVVEDTCIKKVLDRIGGHP